jgi:hypothetical protein
LAKPAVRRPLTSFRNGAVTRTLGDLGGANRVSLTAVSGDGQPPERDDATGASIGLARQLVLVHDVLDVRVRGIHAQVELRLPGRFSTRSRTECR